MSTFLSKLFPGTSSASVANADLGSMESLCAAINDLCREKTGVGEKAAELVRKNKELFEKKPNDVEAFLMHCSPDVGSAAMVAAIKGMFDVSAAKNNEAGTDRAVELLHHFVSENQFVGDHLKLVPEIIFPLLRNVGLYCMEKKDKPDIGQSIITKAFSVIYPRNATGEKVLTSAHSVLFACALKTRDFASVAPFVEVHVDEVANEKCVQETNEDSPVTLVKFLSKKSHHPTLSTSLAPTPYLNPKFVQEYLYNGACILIELKRFEDALLLLEICVTIPAFSLQDQHIEGYKKFILVSLLLNGRVGDSIEKTSGTGTRTIKTKSTEYKPLAEIKFSRSGNTHTKVEELVFQARDRLRKDGNLELAKLVVVEMKKKTILSLVKMFSTVRISDITELANLPSRAQTTELIDELVAENRITVRVEEEMVFWAEVTPLPSKEVIENKIRMVDSLNVLLAEKNSYLKSGSRLRPSALFNEDEGLSMPAIEH